MQGMMFGGEGPVMRGTWYNVNTGDVFTVRDSFFEDNNYVVSTTDGRYLRYDQLKNYTQSDMPEKELKEMLSRNKTTNDVEEIPDSIKSILEGPDEDYSEYILPDDNISSLGNINNTRHLAPASAHAYKPTNNVASPVVNMNNAIIEKALKNAPKPEFIVSVDWEDYPTKQIEMLKDVMDIPESEILDWYLDNIDMSDVIDGIKTAITNRILVNEMLKTEKDIREISKEMVKTIDLSETPQTEVTPAKQVKKSVSKKTTKVTKS